MNRTSLFNRLTMAALVSALAAVLMVAVGPGLAENPDGPSENASEQAQANAEERADTATTEESSDSTASEEEMVVDASTEEVADAGTAEEATADTESDLPPGQEKQEETAAEDLSASANGNGNPNPNTDTSQTGLPRGQEEDECTNKHDTDDDAEFPGNGANQHGLYDDTCDGRASENGSGGGNANGRPCMGCVGNADDKNPNGQSPNHLGGKDHNAGYECDRNKGVGQGNPAHTDCRPTDIITICHSEDQGDTWSVITDERQVIEDILAEDGPTFAFVVDEDTDPDECEEPEEKKDNICHVEGNGSFHVINISKNAIDAHIAHGDIYPVPANGCPDEEEKKDNICHREGNGSFHVINISKNAIDAHIAHGDIYPVPADGCEEDDDDDFDVCHVDGDEFDIIRGLTEEELDDHLDDHEDDFQIFDDDDEADCDDDDNNNRSRRLTICHSTDGDNWSVLTLSRRDALEHLDDHELDKVVSRGTSPSECEEETELCPPGSDFEGIPMPVDGVCDEAETEGGLLCPPNSDLAGMPLPGGKMVNCYEDEVLGELQQRPGLPPAAAPGAPPGEVEGGVLPFTGASVLAFLVLALQLIAAGSLILRGKKA